MEKGSYISNVTILDFSIGIVFMLMSDHFKLDSVLATLCLLQSLKLGRGHIC